MPLTPSKQFEYDSARVLGEPGRDGTVYRGRCLSTGKEVAVKCLAPARCKPAYNDSTAEGRMLASLDGAPAGTKGFDRLLKPLAVEQGEDRSVFLVLPLCAQGDLLARTVELGKMTENNAAKATRDLLLAVSCLHKLGWAHCDIKLDNCLCDDEGRLVLGDFGLVRLAGVSRQSTLPSPPRKGIVDFYAPELYSSYSFDTCKFDAWGVGACCASLLTGECCVMLSWRALGPGTLGARNPPTKCFEYAIQMCFGWLRPERSPLGQDRPR
jgi:serine/threonine protein kinase